MECTCINTVVLVAFKYLTLEILLLINCIFIRVTFFVAQLFKLLTMIFLLLFSAPFACFVMVHACLTPVNKGVAGTAEIYDI